MWTRDLGDGRTEVLRQSLESRAAIIGFTGSDIEAAVFYPEDDKYLVDRETTVSHFGLQRSRRVDNPPPRNYSAASSLSRCSR